PTPRGWRAGARPRGASRCTTSSSAISSVGRSPTETANGRFLPHDPTGIVVSAASGHQKGPTIATDGAGFLVAWEDQRGTSGDLDGARIGADGTVLDPDGIALVTGSKQQGQPALAWLGENYFLAFTDFASDPKGDVRGELIAGDGQVLGVQGI